jgi:hypothetical protein
LKTDRKIEIFLEFSKKKCTNSNILKNSKDFSKEFYWWQPWAQKEKQLTICRGI